MMMTNNHGNFEDDDDNDRISRLPRDVIDVIVAFLPTRDAARTCVLSNKWRYVWTNQPFLVVDKKFWKDIKQHRLSGGQTCIDFAGIVTRILLRHIGNVEKFVVDISDISCQRHCDINLWLSVLCGRGVKELSIANSASNAYTIPSCVFYALELTSISISNCIMKTNGTLNFSRLQSLTLDGIGLESCDFISTPLLASLSLEKCLGIRGFSISAPKLTSLFLKANDDLNLIPYLICSNITDAYIWLKKSIVDNGDIESVNLLKLLSSWPKITQFILDGPSLKYLTTGIVLDNFSMVLKLTRLVPFNIDLDQIAWILRMIGNSPFLRTLEIWLDEVATNDLEVLEEHSIMNMRIQQLHTVKIRYLKGSKSELQLVKFLLRCSPSLKQLLVEENEKQTSDERLKISKELMRFQHAYPKPEIIFGCYF